MTSTTIKGVLASLAAVAIAGAAIAQSTPPDPAAKDPAVGAGQQSTQTTPMGSTGTPAAGSTSSTPSTAAGSSSSTDTSTSGSTMGASGSTTTTTTTDSATETTKRTVRADRN